MLLLLLLEVILILIIASLCVSGLQWRVDLDDRLPLPTETCLSVSMCGI